MIAALVIALLAATAVAGAGALLTEIGTWYAALRKPPWQPPDWLFGPAWTVIFALTAIAAALGWQASGPERPRMVALFVVNGLLNILWSGLFFRLRRPDWALAEVVPLWLSVLALVVDLAPVSAVAAWLLAPYLAWVAFAAFLNLTIVRLNAPFPGR
ncbi:MAG TPA: TspO/MBR family protein [Acetobacteraceae bacterium]|nr:TspO/MBR family protein [Acetobacteraceae bacterium]